MRRSVRYTDGVTEAADADDEMFGVERLRALVARSTSGAGRLAIDVVEAATSFRGRAASGFDDDCTLVALEISRP